MEAVRLGIDMAGDGVRAKDVRGERIETRRAVP